MEFLIMSNGIGHLAFKFRVPAARAELVGTWSVPDQDFFRPDIEAIRRALPHYVRSAFSRTSGRFWHSGDEGTYFDGVKFHGEAPHLHLCYAGNDRHPMVTLYALPVAEEVHV